MGLCCNILFPISILNIFPIYAYVEILWFSFFSFILDNLFLNNFTKSGKKHNNCFTVLFSSILPS